MNNGDHRSLPKNALPLMDADWIVYMACSAVEYPLDNPAEADFQDVVDVFDGKIKEIKRILNTTEEPIYFFTGVDNFRMDIAKSKEYKGKRKKEKPYHYKNLVMYIEARYPVIRYKNLEADDGMAIFQTDWLKCIPLNLIQPSIIVTPDKDLRSVEGWHYGPEGWNYPSFGPILISEENSYIELSKDRKKVIGIGYKFFYSQLLTGDVVDNIPGLPRTGAVAAVKLLANATTKGEAYIAVRDAYRDVCLCPDEYLKEQADLLWMVRGVNRKGEPVLWQPPLR